MIYNFTKLNSIVNTINTHSFDKISSTYITKQLENELLKQKLFIALVVGNTLELKCPVGLFKKSFSLIKFSYVYKLPLVKIKNFKEYDNFLVGLNKLVQHKTFYYPLLPNSVCKLYNVDVLLEKEELFKVCGF